MSLEQVEHPAFEHAVRNAGKLDTPVEDAAERGDAVATALAHVAVDVTDIRSVDGSIPFRAVEGALDPVLRASRGKGVISTTPGWYPSKPWSAAALRWDAAAPSPAARHAAISFCRHEVG